MTDFVTCNDCGHEFVLDLIERPVCGERTDVGHECPMCHRWYHAFFTTARLKTQAERLQKFKDKAQRSQPDWQRYQRKRAEYRQSFALVNPPKQLQEAVYEPQT